MYNKISVPEQGQLVNVRHHRFVVINVNKMTQIQKSQLAVINI